MYKCEGCGQIFLEPISKKERIGEYMGVSSYEEYPVCPYCGHDELASVNFCKCGQLKEETEDWCENCRNARNEMIESSLHELQAWLKIGWIDAEELMKSYFEEY